MSLFYQQQASPMSMSPYSMAPDPQQSLLFGGGGSGKAPFDNSTSSSSQFDGSGYLPGFLLGGPSSPTVRPQSMQGTLPVNYLYGSNQRHSGPPVATIRPGGARGPTPRSQLLFSGERKTDSKPGGPPVEGLHEHTSSPARTYAPLVTDSPERRQLTFTGLRTVRQATPTTPYTNTPGVAMSGGSSTVNNPVSLSPPQMDPFYSQGETLTSEDGYNEYWITVFGFPAAANSFILEQFSQYGTVLKHEMKEGNWIHLQYQTKLQAKKALSKNGKIFGEGMMVGVQPCIDKNVLGKYPNPPNDSCGNKRPLSMRPLTAAYQASSSSHDVAPTNPNTPQKSTGFISKAMEYVFGW